MSARLTLATSEPAVRKATRTPDARPIVLGATLAPPIRTEAIQISTGAASEFWDLTPLVRGVVARARLRLGQATIFTPHTTTSVVINEAETGFLNDFRRLINTTVPQEAYYEHDDHELRTENLQPDELVNGHAHCRALLVGHASVVVPVCDGEVVLGRWQRVLFVELDQARSRRVIVHAQGV